MYVMSNVLRNLQSSTYEGITTVRKTNEQVVDLIYVS